MSSPCASYIMFKDGPFYLPKPIVQPIHMDDVVAVAPEFEGLPLEAVIDQLSMPETRLRYIQGLEVRDAQSFNRPIPEDINPSAALPTTHLIVAHGMQGEAALAYPCHATVLAAHFSLLAPIPGPYPQPEGFEQRQDIAIPFPAAFDILREFIYTHSSRAMMSRAISMDGDAWSKIVGGDPSDLEEAAVAYSQMGVEEVMLRWRRLYEVYENAAALGLVHDKFWQSIHMASWILVHAVRLCKESPITFL